MMKKLAILLCLLASLFAPEPARAQFTDQVTWGGTAGGTANAITVTINNLVRHTPGVKITFVAQLDNTSTVTFKPNPALSTAPAMRLPSQQGPVALVGGEIRIGNVVTAVYDGTFYQIISIIKANGVTTATTTYVASAADCGRVVLLGTNAFYTVTVGAVGGFPAGCRLEFVNIASRGRGMIVSGLTTFRLLNLQSVALQNVTTNWQPIPPSFLGSTPTFYVNFTLGSDNPAVTDGLQPGAGAFKTFQAAVDAIQSFRTGGTIQADCDSGYDQAVSIVGYPSTPSINVLGNPATPASCPWTRSAGDNIIIAQDHATIGFSGFQLGYASGGVAVACRQFSIVDLGTTNWASNSATSVGAAEMCKVNIAGVQTFISVAGSTFVTANNAIVNVGATLAVTSSTMTNWFVSVQLGLITGAPVWSVGSIGGTAYACNFNSVINLSTAYPGGLTIPGPQPTGCQHTP